MPEGNDDGCKAVGAMLGFTDPGPMLLLKECCDRCHGEDRECMTLVLVDGEERWLCCWMEELVKAADRDGRLRAEWPENA